MTQRRMTLAALAFAAAGALACVPVAGAQPSTEITPFVGYYIASDLYNTGLAHVELKNSFMWGGRLTMSPHPRAAVEFAYTRTGSDVQIDNIQAGQPRRDLGHVDFDNYDLNFLALEPTGNPRVTPFGEIGFGWAVSHPKIDADFIGPTSSQPDGNTLFNFNFGIGTKIEMNPKMSLRLDARWRVMDTNISTSSGVWCDPWGYCYSYATDWYNSGELSAGLSYRFK